MAWKVEPTGQSFGAYVSGGDLAQELSKEDFDVIHDALWEHLILIFPEQSSMLDSQYAGLGHRFGTELNVQFFSDRLNNPDHPDVLFVSNDPAYKSVGNTMELGWHTNLCYQARVASVSMLNAIELPPPGHRPGTHFADLRSAYASLTPEVRAQIEDLQCWCGYDEPGRAKQMRNDNSLGHRDSAKPRDKIPQALHDLVRVHPKTGRKSLYGTGVRAAADIPGMGREEASSLMQMLMDHCTQPEFVYKHDWADGDLLIWDNWSTLHRRDEWDPQYTRNCRLIDVLEETASGIPNALARRASGEYIHDDNEDLSTLSVR